MVGTSNLGSWNDMIKTINQLSYKISAINSDFFLIDPQIFGVKLYAILQ